MVQGRLHSKLLYYNSQNGDIYEGEWSNNRQHGEFVIKGENKKTVVTIWRDGELISTKEKVDS
jgi:hypothetical protein